MSPNIKNNLNETFLKILCNINNWCDGFVWNIPMQNSYRTLLVLLFWSNLAVLKILTIENTKHRWWWTRYDPNAIGALNKWIIQVIKLIWLMFLRTTINYFTVKVTDIFVTLSFNLIIYNREYLFNNREYLFFIQFL